MRRERIARVVRREERLDPEALEERARAIVRSSELVTQLVVDRASVRPAQRFLDSEHLTQFVREPHAGGCAAEEVDLIGEQLPDTPVVHWITTTLDWRDTERLERQALGVEHPADVVVRDDEELSRRAERRGIVGEEARIHVAMRADDRQVSDALVQPTGDSPLARL